MQDWTAAALLVAVHDTNVVPNSKLTGDIGLTSGMQLRLLIPLPADAETEGLYSDITTFAATPSDGVT